MSQCKVPSCPPVGETMHFVGKCFCSLCTCGQHKCPNTQKENKYFPSTLSSIYQKDYSKKSGVASKYPINRPFVPFSPMFVHTQRNDLSTNQADFTYSPTSKVPSAKYDRGFHNGQLKLASSSCYKNDFPNWGNYDFVNVSKFKRPPVFRNFEYSPTTTYGENFKLMPLSKVKSERRLENRSPIPKGDFDGLTTSKKHFKATKKEHFPQKAKNLQLGIIALESPKQAYSTFYKREFNR